MHPGVVVRGCARVGYGVEETVCGVRETDVYDCGFGKGEEARAEEGPEDPGGVGCEGGEGEGVVDGGDFFQGARGEGDGGFGGHGFCCCCGGLVFGKMSRSLWDGSRVYSQLLGE